MTLKPSQILTDKINELSLRERAILMGVLLTCITLAFLQFAIDPISKDIKQAQKTIRANKNQTNEVENQLKRLKIEYSIDPNKKLYQEKNHLHQKIIETEKQLEAVMFSLVTPKKMVSVIRDLFVTGNQIQLLSFNTLPPTPVIYIQHAAQNNDPTSPKTASAAAELPGSEKLFRHGIQVSFRSDFHTALTYLASIEALKWQFYWHELQYQVIENEHPSAIVTLEIHTFSRESGVLGV